MGAVSFIFKIVIIRDAVNGFSPAIHISTLAIELLIETKKNENNFLPLYASYKSRQMYNMLQLFGVNVETGN